MCLANKSNVCVVNGPTHSQPRVTEPTFWHKICICKQNHIYRKTSNISRTLAGDKIVDNSDVFGASLVGAAPTASQLHLILNLTFGFNGLVKDKCKTKWETFKFWDLVRFILQVFRYICVCVFSVYENSLMCFPSIRQAAITRMSEHNRQAIRLSFNRCWFSYLAEVRNIYYVVAWVTSHSVLTDM